MALREYWIQIENRFWDMAPHQGLNRMTGESMPPSMRRLVWTGLDDLGNPVEIESRNVQMFLPVSALILRRYQRPQNADLSDAWTVPDDRRVNPWDLNEPDPAETMGTIPGPVIECNVGDQVRVHFRNADFRAKNGTLLHVVKRTHSLHPHGIVFPPEYDGAYPLSPPDETQPVDPTDGTGETRLWDALGVAEFKKGDRVPPGGTFTYSWDTDNRVSTAGVWLYHDHAPLDHHNVLHGAIGVLVIHDPHDPEDVFVDIDHDLGGAAENLPQGVVNGGITSNGSYVAPATKALFLQLYHELTGGGMCINGRKFLGNAPTLVAGLETKLRFGLVAMNNAGFHTFHLHGHRWVIPGPRLADQGSDALSRAVSQVEDTKIFGPANSFSFTIDQGSDMGPPKDGGAKGEWHMHCHVLDHMMNGMMGSLLIVEEGDSVVPLPTGVAVPPDDDGDTSDGTSTRIVRIPRMEGTVTVADGSQIEIVASDLEATVISRTVTIAVQSTPKRFVPADVEVAAGSEVVFDFQATGHTVHTHQIDGNAEPIEINAGAGITDSITKLGRYPVTISGDAGAVIHFRCENHPLEMRGRIRII